MRAAIWMLLLGFALPAHGPGGTEAPPAGSSAQQPMALDDPMFGISFNPGRVNYERIPARVRACPDFARGRWWVFAHASDEGGEYFVVLGVQPGQDGDSFGNAVWLKGSSCEAMDATWMLSGHRPAKGYGPAAARRGLPGLGAPRVCDSMGSCHYVLRSRAEEDLLRALVADGIRRGVAAWGGKAQFRARACAPSMLEGLAYTPIVQQELRAFCTSGQ